MYCNIEVRERYDEMPKVFEVIDGVYHSPARCRDRLARRVTELTRSRDAALEALGTAVPAAKWVVDHAPRHDAHDQEHAKLALERARVARTVLRHE